MEYYDVIIIGGGIAGCGLAYNLKRIGYTGSVLMIEKNEIGFNEKYGTRTMFEEIINEYNFKPLKTFKGIKIGFDDEPFITIKTPVYLVEYKRACEQLFKKSNANYKMECVVDVKGDIIVTENNSYHSKYIIDCSGTSFFLRKKLKLALPFRYWVGDVSILRNNINIESDHIYYNYGDKHGYIEEINISPKYITHGYWQYVKNIDFSQIKPPEKTFYKKHLVNTQIIKKAKVIIPATPVLPLVYKKIAFFGDSFGIASSSTAYGTGPILDSSKILSIAIKKGDLKYFERVWCKKYFKSYFRSILSKYDGYHDLDSKFIQKLKKYPSFSKPAKRFFTINKGEDLLKLFKDPTHQIRMPKEVIKMFPKRKIIFLSIYYIYLKSKYLLMKLK
ncbi:MAG: FAD-dependent oxidoreductase [Nanoarchaeota archaeon]|nr:FAD-dependent oxidoreductase [Nanoarchaeota archaeon]